MGQKLCGGNNTNNAETTEVRLSNIEDVNLLDFNRNSTYKKLDYFSLELCISNEKRNKFYGNYKCYL